MDAQLKDHLDVSAFPDRFVWGLASPVPPLESGLDLLASLSVGGYRLPVSWPRLQPDGHGELDPEAVRCHRRVLAGLRARGIEPFVTLDDGNLPAVIEARGGWAERETATGFADYAAKTVAALGDLATRWITFDEPAVLRNGEPTSGLAVAVAAAYHLTLAHGLAVTAIRAVAPSAKVGITTTVTDVAAATGSAADRAAADRLDAVLNRMFLAPIHRGRHDPLTLDCVDPLGLWAIMRTGDLDLMSTPTDFAGIGHGRPVTAFHDPAAPFEAGRRPAHRDGHLHRALTRVATDYTTSPLYLSENVHDLEHLRHLTDTARALSDGVDVRGYFAWSFMDNLEWAGGHGDPLGIVHADLHADLHADRRAQHHLPRLSAHWYRDLIVAHGTVHDVSSVPAA